ncbi:MAG: hypothetical protein ABII97_02045 [Patescibacteria group bacterium]
MNNKKFLTTIVFVIVLNLIAISLFCFFVKEVNEKKEKVSEVKKELVSFEQKIKGMKNAEFLMATNKEFYREMKSIFLKKEDLIVFVEELEFLAEKSGVNLEIKSINVPSGDSGRPEIGIGVEGNFRNIYNYLVLLENDMYQTEIKKFYFQKLSKNKDGFAWAANLELGLLSYSVK